jgi:hypothetical protein
MNGQTITHPNSAADVRHQATVAKQARVPGWNVGAPSDPEVFRLADEPNGANPKKPSE